MLGNLTFCLKIHLRTSQSRRSCEKNHLKLLPEILTSLFNYRGAQKLGKCKLGRNCPNGSVFWPPDDKCYALYTRGPCPKGKLLTVGAGKIGECKVSRYKDYSWYLISILFTLCN